MMLVQGELTSQYVSCLLAPLWYEQATISCEEPLRMPQDGIVYILLLITVIILVIGAT